MTTRHHSRTLDPDSPQAVWDYTRWALDDEAALAWPGCVFVRERIVPVQDREGRVRVEREYTQPRHPCALTNDQGT